MSGDRVTGALVREGDIPPARRVSRDAQRGYSLPDDVVIDGAMRKLAEVLEGGTFIYHLKRYTPVLEGGPMYEFPDMSVVIVARVITGEPVLPTLYWYESELATYADWMLD